MEEEEDQSATIIVRIIKSFEYKNFRALIFHDVNLHTCTLHKLREMVRERIQSTAALKQFEAYEPTWNVFKMYYQRHGAKTNNPMINVDSNPALILGSGLVEEEDDIATLYDLGLRHESEVSLFEMAAYEAYSSNPTTKWE